jgi:hypothetical protein
MEIKSKPPYLIADSLIAPQEVQTLFTNIAKQTARYTYLDENNNGKNDTNKEMSFEKNKDGKIYFGMSTSNLDLDPKKNYGQQLLAVYDPKTKQVTSQNPLHATLLEDLIVNGHLDQKTVRPVDLTPKKVDPKLKG